MRLLQVFLESKTRLHNENVSMFIALHISGSLFVMCLKMEAFNVYHTVKKFDNGYFFKLVLDIWMETAYFTVSTYPVYRHQVVGFVIGEK